MVPGLQSKFFMRGLYDLNNSLKTNKLGSSFIREKFVDGFWSGGN